MIGDLAAGTDVDARLRNAAMTWLERRTRDGQEDVRYDDVRDFAFEGRRIPLMDPQRGIRKPRGLDAALSIRTVYTPEGRPPPYADRPGTDGLERYQWRGDDPHHPENVALRVAMERQLPLIWFYGVGPGRYTPLFPVYLLGEEQALQQFVVATDPAHGIGQGDSPMEEQFRRYVKRETKQRLHQPVFRNSVLRAYEVRCAVCALGHRQLLDAAHIIPDRDEAGIPAVRNGLAMCKIHHAAYDGRILGIRPDLVVEIRHDILDESDGPMLLHGLQGRHGQRLMVVPRSRNEKPDPQLLEANYAAFTRAS